MTAVMSTTLGDRASAWSGRAARTATAPVARTAPSAPTPRTRLRLTRRGRFALAILVAAPLIAAAALFGPGALGAVAGTQGSDARFQHVTVVSGQSLWQIAESVAPTSDPRDVVAAIVDLNGLTSSVVVPGEQLAIPQQYSAGH